MKKDKLKLATKILAIVIICLISFVGIYVQNGNRMENALKDFTLGKDLKGYRQIVLKVHSEDGENVSENLNKDNYEKSKKIIEKRLMSLGVNDFNLSIDKETGLIYMQIPEDDKTDRIVSTIAETGSVEIKDSEDENNVLISSDKFKGAKVVYTTADNSGTVVYLELQFNKEGKEILKNISENDYRTVEDENSNTTSEETTSEENSKTDEEKNQKKIALYMSGSQITTTSFEETVEDGRMQLRIGQASTDADVIGDNLTSGSTMAAILNNGILPVEYEVEENEYVKTDISSETVRNSLIAVSIVIGILLIYMIIKNKTNGILASISYIGFIATYLLLLRYTNVEISLEGIVAGVIMAILNYFFVCELLKINAEASKKYYKEYGKLLIKLLPIFAISIIFCFVRTTSLVSLGMVMFWGILLISVYNVIVTKNMLK